MKLLLLYGSLSLGLLVAFPGEASADSAHRGRALFERACQSCHVTTRVPASERSADGRTVLYDLIRTRVDADLLAYVTDKNAKRPKDCLVQPLSVYEAPLLLAHLRAATKPEQKELVPIPGKGARDKRPSDDLTRQRRDTGRGSAETGATKPGSTRRRGARSGEAGRGETGKGRP